MILESLGVFLAVRVGLSYADVQMVLGLTTMASLLMNLHIASRISDLKVYIHENFIKKGEVTRG